MNMSTSDDHLFQLVLAVGSAMLFPVALYYRVKSQATGEKLDRRQEGWFLLVGIRLMGALHAAGLFAFLIRPASMSWSSLPLPPWLRWVGAGLGVVGGCLFVWTFRTLGPNLTDTVVTRKRHTLVTAGPYRWVRHPFYVAVGFSVLANALAAANVFLFVTGGAVLLLLVMRTRIEEASLVERFGNAYRAYTQRTGRFFPSRRPRT